jgi:hypothetical protein
MAAQFSLKKLTKSNFLKFNLHRELWGFSGSCSPQRWAPTFSMWLAAELPSSSLGSATAQISPSVSLWRNQSSKKEKNDFDCHFILTKINFALRNTKMRETTHRNVLPAFADAE